MSYDVPGFEYTGISGEEITQYVAVRLQSDGQYDEADGAGVDIDGVSQHSASAAGSAIRIMVTGISKMLVGTGGVTVGDKVQVVSDGITTAASGDYVIGTALATGVAGVLVPVLLGSYHKLA